MNVTLCNECTPNFNLNKILFCKSKKNLTLSLCNDLIKLIDDKDVDNAYIDRHILNKIIQITHSEYGFIGEVKGDKLYTKSITNIAWNNTSNDFYHQNKDHELVFDTDKTIFGCSIKNSKPIIVNKYDYTRDVLPPGHPRVRRFLGFPLVKQGEIKYFVGVCNKLTKFNKSDIKSIKKILDVGSLVLL